MFYLLILICGDTEGESYIPKRPKRSRRSRRRTSSSSEGERRTTKRNRARVSAGELLKIISALQGVQISGLVSHTHGYHYSYPTPPTAFNTTTAPSFGHFGSGPLQTQWHELYERNKTSGNTGSSQTGHNGNEMLPSSDLASNRSDNPQLFQAVPEKRNNSKPTTENDPMDNMKKNDTTTRRPPFTTPRPGTLSLPVPKLGELFAPSLQWHVGIYSKRFTPYMQVCGGSLVRADVVLSAAHCFWDDEVGALRASLFAVAAGKLLRPWQTDAEIYSQHSDIIQIEIPPRFQGVKTSFQDDIAIVFLSTPLEYAPGVKPICLSFDLETERRHLRTWNLGKIAGWGLTMPNGSPSQRLNYLELPYVDIQECIRTADPSFLKYITSDKICAGDRFTGRALCRGDSGGGLAYNSDDVPYLMGIASTAVRNNNQCNAYAVATFTYPRAHSAFLLEHVPGIGEGCEGLYSHGTAVQNEMGDTQNPTIREANLQIPQLGSASNESNVATDDRMSNIVTNTNEGIREPVTDQKIVMMSVESGERSVVKVPVEGASTFIFNCYCKN